MSTKALTAFKFGQGKPLFSHVHLNMNFITFFASFPYLSAENGYGLTEDHFHGPASTREGRALSDSCLMLPWKKKQNFPRNKHKSRICLRKASKKTNTNTVFVSPPDHVVIGRTHAGPQRRTLPDLVGVSGSLILGTNVQISHQGANILRR